MLTVTSVGNGAAQFALIGVGSAASIAFDPGAASVLSSSLGNPQGIAQDGAGNTYIADTGNNRVLKIAVGGTSTVIAGTGTSGYTGDGAAATAATLNSPGAVAVNNAGVISIADTGNNVIRQINPVTGFISTVAGGGTGACGSAQNTAADPFGDGCPGTNATFKRAFRPGRGCRRQRLYLRLGQRPDPRAHRQTVTSSCTAAAQPRSLAPAADYLRRRLFLATGSDLQESRTGLAS